MEAYKTINEYIAQFPRDRQAVLESIRSVVKEVAPDATETIGYGIPTFKLKGKNLVHFAAFGRHYSFFPGSEPIEAFKDQLSDYKTSKGTIQLPADQPVPLELIKEITLYRAKQITD